MDGRGAENGELMYEMAKAAMRMVTESVDAYVKHDIIAAEKVIADDDTVDDFFDKVKYNGKECFIWGRRTSGYFVVKTIDGKVVHNSASYKKLKLLERSNNYLIQ